MNRTKVRRALLSVSDKTNLVDFAEALANAGVEIVASGGTAATLLSAGLPVTSVESVTGAAEMLDGRVKTLHPNIHGAILADVGKPEHRSQLEERDIVPIQLVVVNLYPFEEGLGRGDLGDDDLVELIDIGGPAMVRAAAKNHRWVGIVTAPDQYSRVLEAIEAGGLDDGLRRDLAREAFYRTARYDAAIVGWLETGEGATPERVVLALDRVSQLRYGENPHQEAAVFAERGRSGWWLAMEQLQGKAMSFNNYLDTEAAWRLVNEFRDPTAVIVKHANPCGVASRSTIAEAFATAWECDPLSAFGGVIALNSTLDEATARRVVENFVEVVIAPDVSEGAREALARKKNLRVLVARPPDGSDLDLRRIEHGFVAQGRDVVGMPFPAQLLESWESVGNEQLGADQLVDLLFAWTVVAHTKSNAIVVVKDRAAVGIGAGDQSRVGAARRALTQAAERANGGVVASDGFFPFRDGIDQLGEAGVIAVVEPGGSIRDDEVVAAANEHRMAIVFTGKRHFKH
ncbi:MAG: bifunctional phosphoribosylaminoimidazolecarboxamide formyltransferase/IMP cyclohydrolase [Acidimicrobiia bacterium]|nr:bifunctional phosphoribosylaminoimidazolecarboxamide formyltransferase/IMP cyclohydrolase [Acidimicrobiia bacterium]